VYSAHITRYGSIPTTRIFAKGSNATAQVLLLDPTQLRQIDETEGSYDRVEVEAGVVEMDQPVFSYRTRRGLLSEGYLPIRTSATSASSDLASMSQLEVLNHVASITGCAPSGEILSQQVAGSLLDPEVVNTALLEHSI
jgi:hypothetical protein